MSCSAMAEGDPVPDLELQVTVRVVLAEQRGQLTTRKADSATLDRIAADVVKRLRMCGYRITVGRGSGGHTAGVPRGGRRRGADTRRAPGGALRDKQLR